MTQKKLNYILELHQKWLLDKDDGERADLQYANLQGADLREFLLQDANLRGARLQVADMRWTNLRGVDLRDADLDYSCWPLWCGSLKAHVDDRLAIQLLYHTLSVVQYSPHVSKEIKTALLTESNVDVANRFHRVAQCGRLEAKGETK